MEPKTYIEDAKVQLEFRRTLTYTFDRSLRKGQGGFFFVYEEGSLRCSESADRYGDICQASANKMNVLAASGPHFVYLDCGAWVDNADGNGTRRRDLGIVCGSHVYLCELVPGTQPAPSSRVPSVRQFFEKMSQHGCSLNVIDHVDASRFCKMNKDSLKDTTLYLFIPDFHMPPASWFYSDMEIENFWNPPPSGSFGPGMIHRAIEEDMREMARNPRLIDPPAWLANTPLYANTASRSHHYPTMYHLAETDRRRSIQRHHHADIFGTAGRDLAHLLRALAHLPDDMKSQLRVIHIGDMFELWLNRDYQFRGNEDPSQDDFIPGGVDRTALWSLDVMLQHTPVFEAFRTATNAGVQFDYIWGNHDAYVKDARVTSQLQLPPCKKLIRTLNDDLFVEHGHRFDRSNFDELKPGLTIGPRVASAAFYVPTVRKAEPVARMFTSYGHPDEVDCYLLGASLVYLNLLFDLHEHPFSIYVQGHTHARKLFVFRLGTEYHLYAVPPSGARQTVPVEQ